MKPFHAVVLGSRFGGSAVLVWLRRYFSPAELRITVVDQWHDMTYRPGLVKTFIAGPDRTLSGVSVPLIGYWRRHRINFLHDTIVGLDPDRRLVYTATHPPLAYDVLFIATGSTPRWDAVPGLDLYQRGICERYLARHTAALSQKNPQGRFLFVAGPILAPPHWQPSIKVGCECPLIEAALLWDVYLRRQKARQRAEIWVITAASQLAEDAGPKAHQLVLELLRQRQIRVITNAQYQAVSRHALTVNQKTLDYDHIAWIPPQGGSSWLRATNVDDGYGWVPTDPYLLHPEWMNIYAVGDVVSHSWPKMGHAAMIQARIAAQHWAWRQKKCKVKPSPYEPAILWLMDIEPGLSLFVKSNVFYGGTQEFARLSRAAYVAKNLFQWGYVRTRGALPLMP
ncbi:MAG: FAD/NAD(P)-binding oxidoreductase [Firmicutes bacterium]|nr:FAD/NAD(P)-binding oxidoreductase [Bacillota bacterium]